PPVVFLAGLGNTGHEFDAYAPDLTRNFRVICITRRAAGASTTPASGYDLATLSHDILVVLDTLHLTQENFIGHSFAGGEPTNGRYAHAPSPDSLLDRIKAGAGIPNYRGVLAPALAIYAVPTTPASAFGPGAVNGDSTRQKQAKKAFDVVSAWAKASRDQFRAE